MILSIVVSRELAAALRREWQKLFCDTRIFLLQNESGASNPLSVANQPSPDKEAVSFRISRPLKRRMEKLALERKMTLTELVVSLMTLATSNIELSPDDYRQIADATELAQKRLSPDRRRQRSDATRVKV